MSRQLHRQNSPPTDLLVATGTQIQLCGLACWPIRKHRWPLALKSPTILLLSAFPLDMPLEDHLRPRILPRSRRLHQLGSFATGRGHAAKVRT